METTRIGERGTLILPSSLRERYGLKEGDLVVAEERDDGILLRPAVDVPAEIYTPERKAEFLLNNAVTQEDYDEACRIIREEFNLDPATVPNTNPVMRESLPSDAEVSERLKQTGNRLPSERNRS